MNILRRGDATKEPAQDEKKVAGTTLQRIEITVEREWVSMLIRQKPSAASEVIEATREEPSPLESSPPELAPPSTISRGRNRT